MQVGADPGHGGSNFGCRSPSGHTREEYLTLQVGLAVRRLDSSIYLTRDDDQDISYPDRAKAAELAGVEFMICVHYDSTPWASLKHGTHVYYADGDLIGRDVAAYAIRNALGPLRGGLPICTDKPGPNPEKDWKKHARYLCEVYRCPAVVMEIGYLSNEKDLKYLRRTDGIEDCAAYVLQCLQYAQTRIGARNGRNIPDTLDPLSNL